MNFWDQRYAAPECVYGTEPNAFLVAQRARLRPGLKALAVADGEGRNGVWLAEQGLDVLSVDGSSVAIEKARQLAQSRGVALRFEIADLLDWRWPVDAFDLVAAIFIHFMPEARPRMHAAMYRALRPGGLLVMEAFTPKQLEYKTGGPPVREMLYTPEMLRADFTPDALARHGMPAGSRAPEIVQLEEYTTELREGRFHHGRAAVVRLLLRRPC